MLWKVVEAIINTCLRTSIQFHDALHGFCVVNTKIKIAQELTCINQYPIFLVFLDVRKASDTVERFRLIRNLERYSVGPQMYELLATFWVHQKFATRKTGYHSPKCKATYGTVQGGIISPNLFNVVMDNLVWE